MPLLRKIACAIDGPDPDGAFEWAAELAERSGAELLLIESLPPPATPYEAESPLRPAAEATARRLVEKASRRNLKARKLFLKGSGPLHRRLANAAAAEGADLLVVPRWKRWRLARCLFAGLTERLIARAPCPILVADGRKRRNRV